VIAYSHCIAHGYNLDHGLEQQKLAVDSGFWPLYRFDPRKASPMTVDATPKIPVADFLRNETRFRAAADEATIAAIQESCDEQMRHLRNIAENPEAAVV
jgi:pyruvate-ferredoxin/flavodoxin oxidoreductase